MWPMHDFGWGIGVLAWMLFVWAAVGATVWFVLREFRGPHRHVHR